ncbi:MAG: chromosome segregation protein SMC [Syntrophales bacterium]|nr:chromosome segregation protein SMC [Syntrophales bacterium]
MRLTRIEIFGFKSFRDRVIFDFPGGITAIVGPNGAGKSNFVDALRWVMGEQRIRSLRGKSMQDVLFAGTDQMQPSNLAEVSIILNRRPDFSFPSPYESCDEVMITRRLYRDGESEYEINRVSCRLSDVREFFMGTGVGSRSYAVIEQNNIFDLVEARPEDRRYFIEEAAGISKYKSRREEAMRKMEAAKQNLLRVNDVLKEVKTNLNSLKRQARRAEQFRSLKNAVRENEILLARYVNGELLASKMELLKELEVLTEKVEGLEIQLNQIELIREEGKIKLIDLEGRRELFEKDLFNFKHQIELKEKEIEYSESKIEELIRDRERWVSVSLKGKERLEIIEKNILEWNERIANIEMELSMKRKNIEKLEYEVRKWREEEWKIRKMIDEKKKQYVDIVAERARLKNMILMFNRTLDEMEKRLNREKEELSKHDLQLQELKKKESAILKELQDWEKRVLELQSMKDETSEKEKDLKTVTEKLDLILAELKDEFGHKSTRLNSLREFHDSYAWCNEATRNLLKINNQESSLCFLGLVADFISVPPPYERAVEAVLGEKLGYVIVKNPEDGVSAIELLKRQALGRTTFVPLELRIRKSVDQSSECLEGVVKLINFVDVREEFRPVVEFLLGDVILIPDLRSGLNLWRQNGFRGTFVTPDGDLITSSGLLSGGSAGANERYPLKDRREMRELELSVQDLRATIDSLTEKRRLIKEEQDNCHVTLARISEELHGIEIKCSGLRKDLEKVHEDLRRAERAQLVGRLNVEQLLQDKMGYVDQKKNAEGHLAKIQEEVEFFDGELTSMESHLDEIVRTIHDNERNLTEEKVQLVKIEGNLKTAIRERELQLRDKKKILESVSEGEKQMIYLDERISEIKRKIAEDKKFIVETHASYLNAEKNLQLLLEELNELRGKQNDLEQEIKSIRAKRDEKTEELRNVKVELDRIKSQSDALRRMIGDKYGVDISKDDRIVSLESEEVERIEAKLRKDREELDNFGEVNLLAIDEYEQVKSRYDFLTSQVSDLNNSIATLQRTIARINRDSRERFAETYNGINGCFQEVFSRMFPGGKAELILTDESDLLETGVDISVRLPGKKVQNISLLSGGEKSMISIALIMAILIYKPAPFLVLDEVDAALDDSNIDTFTVLLQEIAARSQIILITHNKRTMGIADHIYGITMERKGVSTVVSVKMK